MRISSFEAALQRLAQVLGIPIAALRKIFAGREAEAIALARLSDKEIWRKYQSTIEKVKLDQIVKRNKVTKKFGKEIFDDTQKYSRNRIERVLWNPKRKLPKGTRKSDFKELGRLLQRGKNRGSYQLYVDRLYEQPISIEMAKKQKKKNREVRFTQKFLETPISQLKSLKKFISKSTLRKLKTRKKDKIEKRKKLTKAEAKEAAKALSAKVYRQDVFVSVSEVFGY